MQQTVTIILPVSRRDYLSQVFTALEMLECDRKKTNLLVIVDGDDELFIETRNHVAGSKFNEALCVPYSKRGEVSEDLKERRVRIAEIHNELKTYLSEKFASEFVLGVEDDTLIPPKTLKILLQDYIEEPHAGFIEGVELGRWGKTYIGAWRADDVYEPTVITSIMPPEKRKDLEMIDAGGLFCFMAKTDTYRNHEFKVFQNNGMGPDADFGMKLREMGYSNFIDWRIQCTHLNGDEKISIAINKPEQVYFKKRHTTWSFYVK